MPVARPSGRAPAERLLRLIALKNAVARSGAPRARSAERPRVVAGAGVLDLDDVGAEVGEVERAHGPRQQARQVEHANAGERCARHRQPTRRSPDVAGNAEFALDRARGGERVVERGAEARDVAHLAAAPRLAPCRTGAAWRAGGASTRVQSGSRGVVAAARRTRCRPAGSPSPRACAATCRRAAGPRARAPAARTATSRTRRSCSGRCCAGAARSR